MVKGIMLFMIQGVVALIAAFNMRAIAQANYTWVIISEIFIGLLVFISIKEIAEKTNRIYKCLGYILGSVVGSILGVYLSKLILMA